MTVRAATSACRMVRLSVTERGCSDGLLGLLVNTEVRSMGGFGDSWFASHFEVLFNKELTSQAFYKSGIMKMSMDFLCVLFFFCLFCFILSQ